MILFLLVLCMATPKLYEIPPPLDIERDGIEAVLAEMPGVFRRGASWTATPDVVGEVSRLLAEYGIDAVVRPKGAPARFELGPEPRGFEKLWTFQREDAEKLARGERHGTYTVTGGGKTCTALAAAGLAGAKRVLVVTRAIGRGAWVRDAQWMGDYRVGVLFGEYNPTPPKARATLLRKEQTSLGARATALGTFDPSCSLIVAGWETLSISKDEPFTDDQGVERVAKVVHVRPDLLQAWDLIIFDEAHYMAHLESQRSQAAFELSQLARTWLLTATPIPNRTIDLWNQLRCVSPSAWGLKSWRFARVHTHARPAEVAGLDTTGPCSANADCSFCRAMKPVLRARLRYWFSIRDKSVIAGQLPPKRREVRLIGAVDVQRAMKSLPVEQRRGYEGAIGLAADCKTSHAADEAADVLAGRGKCLLVGNRHRWLPRAIRATMKALNAYPAIKRELWFGVSTGSVDETVRAEILALLPAGFKISMTPTERIDLFQRYMAQPGPAIIFGTMDSMSESVDAQDSDWMGVVSLPVSIRQLIQLEGRVFRIGMKKPVRITYFSAETTIDEILERDIVSKAENVDHVGLDTMDSSLRSAENKSEEEVIAGLQDWLHEHASKYVGGDARVGEEV